MRYDHNYTFIAHFDTKETNCGYMHQRTFPYIVQEKFHGLGGKEIKLNTMKMEDFS